MTSFLVERSHERPDGGNNFLAFSDNRFLNPGCAQPREISLQSNKGLPGLIPKVERQAPPLVRNRRHLWSHCGPGLPGRAVIFAVGQRSSAVPQQHHSELQAVGFNSAIVLGDADSVAVSRYVAGRGDCRVAG
jgi:hypothetical protein